MTCLMDYSYTVGTVWGSCMDANYANSAERCTEAELTGNSTIPKSVIRTDYVCYV